MNDITVRHMKFDFPDDLDPVYIEGAPEESHATTAFSLLLPYLEPYLIRTMKEAKKQVTDPDLIRDLERFCAQEGQHYRQHKRFNDVMRGAGFPRLQEFEDELESDYRRFSDTKPLRFNLAYAEGFEALTTASACFSFEEKSFERMHPAVGDLWRWHLIEELEHRTVAFDVYRHVVGGYFYRLAAGLHAQWHMGSWIGRVARYMVGADTESLAKYGGIEGRRERGRMGRRAALRGLLPRVLPTYLPWYTPAKIEFTEEMRALASRYTEMATRVS